MSVTASRLASALGFPKLATHENDTAEMKQVGTMVNQASDQIFELTRSSTFENKVDKKLDDTARDPIEFIAKAPAALLKGLAFGMQALVTRHGEQWNQIGAEEYRGLLASTVDKAAGIDRLVVASALLHEVHYYESNRDRPDGKSLKRFEPLAKELEALTPDQRKTLTALRSSVQAAGWLASKAEIKPENARQQLAERLGSELKGLPSEQHDAVLEYGMKIYDAMRPVAARPSVYDFTEKG